MNLIIYRPTGTPGRPQNLRRNKVHPPGESALKGSLEKNHLILKQGHYVGKYKMCMKLQDVMQDFIQGVFPALVRRARQGSRLFTATVYQGHTPCWALT